MNPTIRVDNLGKQYRIGGPVAPYSTLRDSIRNAVRNSMDRLSGRGRARAWVWALKDVGFEVMQGEVIGIVGRNGAGKSTLLKVLSRITEPTTGSVDLYGRVGSLLEVGTGFHGELSGRENVFLNGAILGMKKSEINRKFDEIVAFAEIDEFIDTPVKHYSSGMYLRLAFAVAAHLETEILLVDEVLAVGDVEFQRKCMGKMGSVAKEGRTIMFVSHQVAAVQQLCSRAFLMRSGRAQLFGDTETVLASYLSDAVSSTDGNFDLTSHPARAGQGKPIIRGLRLSSVDGTPTSSFYPRDAMTVEITLDAPSPVRNPRIALAVEDSLGRRLTTFASYFSNSGLPDIAGACRVRCTMPSLMLGPGRYLMSVSIGNGYGTLLDSLDSAVWFEVGWRNSYGNGEPFDRAYGPVLTESVWERL
jgi:lipopolysaccharide transport system ATP-binding protein